MEGTIKMKSKNSQNLIVFTDGGSRGNPGKSAVGVYIPSLEKKYSKYLGVKTNNEAEYEGVIFALKKIKALLGSAAAAQTELSFRLDSDLIVQQLNGTFKIMEEKLKPLFIDVWNLKQDYKTVTFTHVPREENSIADGLVNQELDNQQGELFE